MPEESLEEGKERVKRMMKKNPEETIKLYTSIKELYQEQNRWNEEFDEFHLYQLCISIMREKKIGDLDIFDEDE